MPDTMPTAASRANIVDLIAAARERGDAALSEPDSKALLREIGIPVPAGQVVASPAAAAEAATAIGFPVVVKAVSPALTHKTDAGGIVFPVATPADAAVACALITERVARTHPNIPLRGFLIEAFHPAKLEWILSLRMDAQFGPLIMFGLGGIFVELFEQVAFRLAPLSEVDIDTLLADRMVTRALSGLRGDPPADREGVAAAIRALSALCSREDIAANIAEIEINPLIATARGVVALDALVLLHPGS